MITANGKPANALMVLASPVICSSELARDCRGDGRLFALLGTVMTPAPKRQRLGDERLCCLPLSPGAGYLITAGVVRLLKS